MENVVRFKTTIRTPGAMKAATFKGGENNELH